MEAFEHFVAVALASEDLVVTSGVKFKVSRQTARTSHREVQCHGYEVDLVGARSDQLVLATVKSYFGSRGVIADHVKGTSSSQAYNRRYALLNDRTIRDSVVSDAARRYGYEEDHVELRMYVGRFAAPTTGRHETEIRQWAGRQRVGGGPIQVYGVEAVVDQVLAVSEGTEYLDDSVLVTLKVLRAAGRLC